MRPPRWRALCSVAILLLILALGLAAHSPSDQAPPPAGGPVRLGVLLLFDQLRGDYLERWSDLFEEGGWRRLTREGAWFQNCHYPYSGTLTGPGHASIASGCSPDRHGIIANNWFDRTSASDVYCATMPRYQQVPPRLAREGDKQPIGAGSPQRLRATIADAVRQAQDERGRIVALSLKDRSAVLPGGQRPDACYWWDTSTGLFVTSTYYRDQLHPWVKAYNKAYKGGPAADRWFKEDWDFLHPELDYAARSGPDDAAGEGIGIKQGRTFPHPTDGGLTQPGKAYYDAVYNSPYGNDLLLGLVKRAVDAEKLGQRDAVDLLCVSFSSNDPVGHCWGPDSQEVLDMTLRSDRIVKELLEHLDARVGRGRYLVVLSADHGICPLPEQAPRRGQDALRLSSTLFAKAAEAFLQQTMGQSQGGTRQAIQYQADGSFYLNPAWVRATGLGDATVQSRLAEWAKHQPGILTAFTRGQLQGVPPVGDTLAAQVRRSFDPQRSGDVIVVLKPGCLMIPQLTGTTHGSPHEYDTHVPLVVFGPGVRPQVRSERVTPLSTAAILAHALGAAPPGDAVAPVPEGLWVD